MFTFLSGKYKDIQECSCKIEPKTRLLVVEQKRKYEEYPRYIRLTGQQVNRIKQMFFKGSFYSATRPSNFFTLDNSIVTMCCRADNQVIKLSLEEMGLIYGYYEKHKNRIAKYDVMFKK